MTSKEFLELLAEFRATVKKLEQSRDADERRDLQLVIGLLIKEAHQVVALEAFHAIRN